MDLLPLRPKIRLKRLSLINSLLLSDNSTLKTIDHCLLILCPTLYPTLEKTQYTHYTTQLFIFAQDFILLI